MTDDFILRIVEIVIWPFAVIIIVIAVVVILKKTISKVLERAKKISKDGIDMEPVKEQKVLAENIAYSYDELMRELDSKSILDTEKVILEQLSQVNFNSEDEKNKVILRNLSATRVELEFERIINTIWGSQMDLIKSLNTRMFEVDLNECKQFYENAKKLFPEVYAEYSFDQYLNFLKSSSLLEVSDNDCVITDFGKDFLVYLVKTGQDVEYQY